jgi:phosphatidate cytidylyltransferase
MAANASELRLRVMSALVLAALAIGAVWAGGVVFAVFVSIMAFIVFLEWTAIIGLTAFESARIRAAVAILLLVTVLILLGVWAAMVSLVILTALAQVSTARTTQQLANWTAAAVFYCGSAAIALVGLRNGQDGVAAILLLFAIVWGTDIGAYFVGRKLGGPKLAPAISPGKTQSGAIGGLLIATACAGVIAALTGVFDPFTALFVAISVSVVSQIGDLFESYLKRRFGVKDSGNIIPGHGGMFDRVDGLMPAAIVLFLIIKFL